MQNIRFFRSKAVFTGLVCFSVQACEKSKSGSQEAQFEVGVITQDSKQPVKIDDIRGQRISIGKAEEILEQIGGNPEQNPGSVFSVLKQQVPEPVLTEISQVVADVFVGTVPEKEKPKLLSDALNILLQKINLPNIAVEEIIELERALLQDPLINPSPAFSQLFFLAKVDPYASTEILRILVEITALVDEELADSKKADFFNALDPLNLKDFEAIFESARKNPKPEERSAQLLALVDQLLSGEILDSRSLEGNSGTDGQNTQLEDALIVLSPDEMEATTPNVKPKALQFADTDYSSNQIAGALRIERAASESNLISYVIYWGINRSQKAKNFPPIATLQKTVSDLTYEFVKDTPIPSGVSHILVFAKNNLGESVEPASLQIVDLADASSPIVSIPTITVSETGIRETRVQWEKATDDFTADFLLEYRVFLSVGSELDNPFSIQSNGNEIEDFRVDGPTNIWIENLKPETTYYLNILVEDEEGNLENYSKSSFTTSSAFTFFDINTFTNNSNPSEFFEFNGKLYFAADDGIHGSEVWVYDKDDAETPKLLADIIPGSNDSFPGEFAVFQNKLYFTAKTVEFDRQIFVYDGSSPPLQIFDRQLVDPDGASIRLFPYKDQLLISMEYNPSLGHEIYLYDGLNAPALLMDISPGIGAGGFSSPVVFNDDLYFSADDASAGTELWKYDGENPPSLVADVRPGNSSSSPSELTVFKGNLYFRAHSTAEGSELWVFDGTNSPSIVADIRSGSSSSFPRYLTVFNDTLWFQANNGTNGLEVYSYDGLGSPNLFYDLNPGSGSSTPDDFIVLGSRLYFGAYTGSTGRELFFTDGTSNPTLAFELNPGSDSSSPRKSVLYNNKIVLQMDTGEEKGVEMVTVGLDHNPEILDLNATTKSGSAGYKGVVFQDKFYFTGNTENSGQELYVYDGMNPPSLVADILPGELDSNPKGYTVFKDKLYFIANDGTHARELMSYDGVNPPSLVADIAPGGSGVFDSTDPIVFNEKLYFAGVDSTTEVELWQYDGLNTPTMVADLAPGSNGGRPDNFFVFQDKLYFSADDHVHGRELWVYDGTNTPTMVLDIYPGASGSVPESFTVFRESLYFSATDDTNGTELFVYDGVNPPAVVMDFTPGLGYSIPSNLTVFDDKLFFHLIGGPDGKNGLYYFNGSEIISNDPLLENVNSIEYVNATGLEVIGDKLYMSVDSDEFGAEFWFYDGVKPAQMEKDIFDGSGGSYPRHFAPFGNTILFFASSVNYGFELMEFKK